MQQSQRARSNPALEYAVQRANRLGVPLLVVFCLVGDYPDASARHYRFLLEGLAEVESQLGRRGIRFEVVAGRPAEVLAAAQGMAELVCDRGYLPVQARWRRDVVAAVDCPVVEVEGDVVVPVDLVSDKAEVAARTIRPRIQAELDRFVIELTTTPLDHHSVGKGRQAPSTDPFDGRRLDPGDPAGVISRLGIAAEPGPVEQWTGGTRAATALLDRFIDGVLPEYETLRNRYDVEPSSSQLSPYLHFGQISPVEIARKVGAAAAPDDQIEAFVDELVVRRELAINWVLHQPDHARYGGLPEWARTTLDRHTDDGRDVVLTATELEAGDTPDPIWNAIMAEIRATGWVHNQLRMYWASRYCGGRTLPNMPIGRCSTSTTATSSTAGIRTRTPMSPGVSVSTTRASRNGR